VYHRLVRALGRFIIVTVAVAAVLATFAMPYVDALAFIARAERRTVAAHGVAGCRAERYIAEAVRQFTTRHGPVAARLCRAADG
jgi:hypothetical protein